MNKVFEQGFGTYVMESETTPPPLKEIRPYEILKISLILKMRMETSY